MALQNPFSMAAQTRTAEYDMGLRAFMLGVYNYMASALAVTGIVALLASQSPAVMSMMYVMQDGMLVGMKPLGWLVIFAPFVVVLVLAGAINRMSPQAAQATFWGYAALMGLSLSSIFLMYTGVSIARTFFVTAGMFGGMSLYGYTTKRNLTGMGHFLIMGLWGIILASIVNIFMQSSGLNFAISLIGVVVFVGLTAYDTQRLKGLYYAVAGNADAAARASILGALTLYLDFINLFMMLLRFMGDQRR